VKLKRVQQFSANAGEWSFRYKLRPDTRGKLVISELTIVRHGSSMKEALVDPLPEGGITKAVLRSLRLQEELRYARAAVAQDTYEPVERPKPRRRPGPGRPELPITFYRDLGRRWNALVRARDPHPAKTLADQIGRKHSTMRSMLYRYDELARRGWIPRRASNP